MTLLLAAVLSSALSWAAQATTPRDVLLLRNGDRISGRIVGETARSIRIETPYGRLLILRASIEQILRQGKPYELCARTHLAEEDFWQAAWGPQPPYYDASTRVQSSPR